ncbi:MAG: hypothetical protein IPN78_02040 [Candidatus Accumulibacter sp.]|nr:hypothetical protein [Candidatus Accumulibacter propinquus]
MPALRQSAPADFRPTRTIWHSAGWAEAFLSTSGTIFVFHKLLLCLYPAAVILLANTVQGKIHVDGAYVGGKAQSEDKRILAQPTVGRRENCSFIAATISLLHRLWTNQPCATVGIQFIVPPDT